VLHSVAAVIFVYKPGEQMSHCDAPVMLPNEPGKQKLQPVALAAAAKKPASQLVHMVAALSLV
jgi:hypothetical protein